MILIAMGIITRIVARYGEATVAGFGVATRIEAFGLSVVYALSTGISPFVGQNVGAQRFDRIQRALSLANRFCLIWGAFLFVCLWLAGRQLIRLFDPDPRVVTSAHTYLWIVSLSLGLRGIHNTTWTALNVMSRPYDAMALEFLLTFALWLPAAHLGARFAGYTGVYTGLSLANILAGLAAWIWMHQRIQKSSIAV